MTIVEHKFKDLLSNIVDNRGRTCPTAEAGTALIATNCIKNEELYPVFENIRWVDDQTMETWFRGHPLPGDILFVTKGSPGRCCLVPDPVNFCIAQDMVAIRADKEKIHPDFLLALLRSSNVQHAISNMHVGTLIPHFKKGDFSKLYIKLPQEPSIQEAIGRFYLTISKKIALNRKLNDTLEGIARATFQSWFVDFDPVKAKLAAIRCGRDAEKACMAAISGRLRVPPGKPRLETLDNKLPSGSDIDEAIAKLAELTPKTLKGLTETASHFPSDFVESEVGLIPEGWELTSLYDSAQWVNGSAFVTEDFSAIGKGLPVIKIAELKNGISSQTKWSLRSVSQDRMIDTGDLLYSWSGSPETSLEAFLWSGGRGLLNQHIFKVIFENESEKRFVYYLLQYLRPYLVDTAKNKQTTGLGHVTIADMKRLLVCKPAGVCLMAFDALVAPIYDKAFGNTLESTTLAELRDTLLPKLLSGEIKIEQY